VCSMGGLWGQKDIVFRVRILRPIIDGTSEYGGIADFSYLFLFLALLGQRCRCRLYRPLRT